MEGLFITVLNRSYQAALIICVVIFARWILQLLHASKKYSCLLWVIPFLKLIMPFSFQSVLSLFPSAEPLLSADIGYSQIPQVSTGSDSVNAVINGWLPAATPHNSINPMQVLLAAGSMIWILGLVGLLLYTLISGIRLKNRLRCSMPLQENIYLADHIDMPFVWGIYRPRIYVPSNLTKEESAYILAHERMHVARKDHLLKAAAFLLTVCFWFQPLLWIAYLLFSKDMEMACDEAVLRNMGEGERGNYADLLLRYAAGKRLVGVPIAFSEGNLKSRIRNVLRYKKPLIGISVFAAGILLVLAVGLLSDPAPKKDSGVDQSAEDSIITEDGLLRSGFYQIVAPEGMIPGSSFTVWGDQMSFSQNYFSSYLAFGTYTVTEDEVILATSDSKYWYHFQIRDNTLVFVEDGTSAYLMTGQANLAAAEDGSVFVWKSPRMGSEGLEENVWKDPLPELEKLEEILQEEPMGMRVLNVSSIGATIEIYNNSEDLLLYGNPYSLWKLTEDGQWEMLPTLTEAVFTMEAYAVKGSGTASFDLSWEWLYGSLPAGTYQISKQVSLESSTDGSERDDQRLTATFEIGGME